MSFDSVLPDRLRRRLLSAVRELRAPGFPAAAHPSEADIFSRQVAMPGHDQEALERARIGLIGCGGLGSWIGLGLARMGVRHLTLFDDDVFDRSNATRQLAFPRDLQRPKARALAKNLVPHMTNPAAVVSVDDRFGANLECGTFDVFVVGVDNNATRLDVVRKGLLDAVPVVFAMLSLDGLRSQVFLQRPGAACLSCVLPNLDPDVQAPCAAASIASCFLAAAQALHLVVAATSASLTAPTWREVSLDGSRSIVATPSKRPSCAMCQRGANARYREGVGASLSRPSFTTSE